VGSEPLIPAPIYGLRTWAVVAVDGREQLAATQQGAVWPAGGEWLRAECRQTRHAAPAPACDCGVHAWHPRRSTARRILGTRGVIPGVVEGRGAVELHREGFRAEWARPYALVVAPGRNAARTGRLARVHGTEVVEVGGADDLLAWCRDRGLGLDEALVARLLGPDADARRSAAWRLMRPDVLRVVAAIAVAALPVLAGLELATDPPGPRVLKGRAGEVQVD
jgi:hypothetical protein